MVRKENKCGRNEKQHERKKYIISTKVEQIKGEDDAEKRVKRKKLRQGEAK